MSKRPTKYHEIPSLVQNDTKRNVSIRLRALNYYRAAEGLLASNIRNSHNQFLIGISLQFIDRHYGAKKTL